MAQNDQPHPDLSSVVAPPLIDDKADECLAEEEHDWFEKEKKRVDLKGLIEDQEARKRWAERVFWLLVAWLVGVFASVCLEGFALDHFHLSDSVLITLITTTTANVLSLGYIVANYLFPKR